MTIFSLKYKLWLSYTLLKILIWFFYFWGSYNYRFIWMHSISTTLQIGYKVLNFQDGNRESLKLAHFIILPIVQNGFPSPSLSFSHMHPCNCPASKSSFHLPTLCPEPILFLLSVWFTWPKHSLPLFLLFRNKRSSLLILLLWHSPLRFLKRFALAAVHLLCSDLAESSHRMRSFWEFGFGLN